MALHILVPSDPLNPRLPDEYFVEQADAFRGAGYSASVVSDQVTEGNGPLRNVPPGAVVLYRGWMLNADRYGHLETAIRELGATPFVSLAQYLSCHHLPNWYPLIKDLTPETRVYSKDADMENELRELAWPSFFVKDYVKSLKTSAGSLINDPSHIQALLAQMGSFRGEIEGGICVRRVEQFLPETEQRFFVVSGQAYAAEESAPIPALVEECARRISSPFFSVDVVQRKDDVFRVVEIGDGQVSDLVGWSPAQLVRAFTVS